MKNKTYILLLVVLTAPLFSIFTNHFLGYSLTVFWVFLGWLIVINLWSEQKESKESSINSIKNDTLLQQHNKEAEELERQEAQPKGIEDPQQIVRDVMENAEEDEEPQPTIRNPFGK